MHTFLKPVVGHHCVFLVEGVPKRSTYIMQYMQAPEATRQTRNYDSALRIYCFVNRPVSRNAKMTQLVSERLLY